MCSSGVHSMEQLHGQDSSQPVRISDEEVYDPPAMLQCGLRSGCSESSYNNTRSYTADAVLYRQPWGQPTNTVMLNLNWLRVEEVSWQWCVGRVTVPRLSTWYDVTWYDMTWHDGARCDMTWHDVTWRDITWHDVTWREMTWHDVPWRDMRYITWHGVTLRDMTWHDVTWHDVTWPDMTWHDVTWHDVTWPDMTWHDVTWREMTWHNAT